MASKNVTAEQLRAGQRRDERDLVVAFVLMRLLEKRCGLKVEFLRFLHWGGPSGPLVVRFEDRRNSRYTLRFTYNGNQRAATLAINTNGKRHTIALPEIRPHREDGEVSAFLERIRQVLGLPSNAPIGPSPGGV